jgi:hypothetical protein
MKSEHKNKRISSRQQKQIAEFQKKKKTIKFCIKRPLPVTFGGRSIVTLQDWLLLAAQIVPV